MRLCCAAIVMYTHSRIYILSACCSCVCLCLFAVVCFAVDAQNLKQPQSKAAKNAIYTHTDTNTHTQLGTPNNSNSSIACGLCGQ